MERSKYNPQRVTQARKNIIETVPLSLVMSSYGIEVYRDKIVCPFHNDDNPSCMVNDELKTYHCFGCHAKGTVVEFVRDYERIYGDKTYSQIKAIKTLAKDYEVEIPDLEDKTLLQPERKERTQRDKDTRRIINKKLEQVEKRTKGVADVNQRVNIYTILDDYYYGNLTGEEAITKLREEMH